MLELTDSLLTAQAFVFFVAGFETSSTTMSNALYELALDQKVQDKLREEIQEEYAKISGDLTYDDIKKMSYLDKVFKGTSFKNRFPVISISTKRWMYHRFSPMCATVLASLKFIATFLV